MEITLKEKVIQHLNDCYPASLCQSYDKVGLEINNINDITKIMITLEVTHDVVCEAVANNVNFIICHHPLFFKPIESIDLKTSKGHMLMMLLKHDIAVFSIHTNADAAYKGLGYEFAKKLKLENFTSLIPIGIDTGIGGLGQLKQSLPFDVFVEDIKQAFKLKQLKVTGIPQNIKTVAFVNGSGQDAWPIAKEKAADVFISGDITYHHAQDALNEGMLLVEVPHYEEILFCEMIKSRLSEFKDIEIMITTKLQDPFSYY